MLDAAGHKMNLIAAQSLGVTVSTGSGLYSFFSHTLPIVQWFAALLAAVAAAVTLASVVRHWNDK